MAARLLPYANDRQIQPCARKKAQSESASGQSPVSPFIKGEAKHIRQISESFKEAANLSI